MPFHFFGVNWGGEEEGEEEGMEEEEGAAEVEDLLPSGLQSGFFTSDSAAGEILLSLPELEEEEVAGAFGDFH